MYAIRSYYEDGLPLPSVFQSLTTSDGEVWFVGHRRDEAAFLGGERPVTVVDAAERPHLQLTVRSYNFV